MKKQIITDEKRKEIIFLIMCGLPYYQVAEQTGISYKSIHYISCQMQEEGYILPRRESLQPTFLHKKDNERLAFEWRKATDAIKGHVITVKKPVQKTLGTFTVVNGKWDFIMVVTL